MTKESRPRLRTVKPRGLTGQSLSERVLQSELDVALALTALHQAHAAPDAHVRRVQNGGVEQINELTAQLEVLALGDGESLHQVEVDCLQSRSAHGADAATAESASRGGGKRARVVPLVTAQRRVLLAKVLYRREAVGARAAAAGAGSVAPAIAGAHREAGVEAQDGAGLPAAHY